MINATRAIYRNTISSNPLIEALPNININQINLDVFAEMPLFLESERKLPIEIKVHLLNRIFRIVHPVAQYTELLAAIGSVFAQSALNPKNPLYTKLLSRRSIFDNGVTLIPRGKIIRLSGKSGTGKSLAVSKILNLYPKVIRHANHQGDRLYCIQLPAITVTVPFDGYLRAFCHSIAANIDLLLGTNYTDTLIPTYFHNDSVCDQIARILIIHGVSLLIIDDFHLLEIAKVERKEELLNFIDELNQLGISILIVGTSTSTSDVFGEKLAQMNIDSFIHIFWNCLTNSDEWNQFVERLLQYQWSNSPVQYSDQLSRCLLDESLGIIDIAKRIYYRCQNNVLINYDKFDVSLIQKVARMELNLIKPSLIALKQINDSEKQAAATI